MNQDELFYIEEMAEFKWCVMVRRHNSNPTVVKPGLSKRNAEILQEILLNAVSWWIETKLELI